MPTEQDYNHVLGKYDTLRQGIIINKHLIDDELTSHAQKFLDVSEALAECLSYVAEAKDSFDTIQARVDQRIRDDWPVAVEGQPKPPRLTEAAVKTQYAADADWRDAKAERRDWENLNNRFTGLQESYRQRGFMLRSLADLAYAGYFTSPSAHVREPAGHLDRAARGTGEQAPAQGQGRRRGAVT